jgi:alpha-L-rhamnosidase
MANTNPFQEHGASWIWPASRKNQVNQYVEFRHELELPAGGADAELTIIADANYAVWVNGQFVGTGQFANYPDLRTWDVLPVPAALLKKGKNVLAVLVRYTGVGIQAYIPGEPGLIYVLRSGKDVFVSGPSVRCRPSPCYRQGPVPRISRQLGFTFEYDARNEDGWQELGFVAGPDWAAIAPADIAGASALGEPIARPVARLTIGERTPASVVANGVFRRCPPSGSAGATLAWVMERDYLSTRLMEEVFAETQRTPVALRGDLAIRPVWKEADGVYFVIDLGREEAGVLELELEANRGAIVDLSHGEHLNDLRVRSETGGRNFSDRYVCKEGRQLFRQWVDRWAGRYIQLHIHGLGEKLVLHYAGLRTTEYPIERKGSFRSPDELANRIHEVSVRTLHLCMHERYEDCPWREQALYANDARNQALCGYYCFGEYRFPQVAFDSLGRGYHDDGYLEMTAPAQLTRTIPSFSMVWIIALQDHLMHSGDAGYIRGQMPVVHKLLGGWLRTLSGGLMPAPTGDRFWHFYDWADGMDGSEDYPSRSWVLSKPRFDAPLNLYLCLALEAASHLAKSCGEAKQAERYSATAGEVRAAVHQRFFDAAKDAYKTYMGEGTVPHFAELTQALTVLAGAAPGELAGRLRERLAGPVVAAPGFAKATPGEHDAANHGTNKHDWVVATLSQAVYKFLALMGDRHRHGQAVIRKIGEDWGQMLFRGATSFWEVLLGAEGWAQGASLCHGWSATPVYFYQAYLLGVQPLTPGFAQFTVDPVISAAPCAEGRVPTPHGPIDLKWQRAGDHVIYELKHPKGTKPVFPSAGKNDILNVVEA